MPEPTEKEIQARAYQIWEPEGRPENREEEFWHLAQQELRNEVKSYPTGLLTRSVIYKLRFDLFLFNVVRRLADAGAEADHMPHLANHLRLRVPGRPKSRTRRLVPFGWLVEQSRRPSWPSSGAP